MEDTPENRREEQRGQCAGRKIQDFLSVFISRLPPVETTLDPESASGAISWRSPAGGRGRTIWNSSRRIHLRAKNANSGMRQLVRIRMAMEFIHLRMVFWTWSIRSEMSRMAVWKRSDSFSKDGLLPGAAVRFLDCVMDIVREIGRD